MRKHSPINRQRTAGLTLVEILITLLVMSIGLLGVAGLHAMSLRNNYDALMRSHASTLAADIADRMRANRGAAIDYQIDLTTNEVDVGEDPPISATDLSEWRKTLAAQLPQGTGAVLVQLVDGRIVVTITIQWGERGEDEPIQFQTRTEV